MRTSLLYCLLLLTAGVVLVLSCKKEHSCESCNKKPPVAIAGDDRVVILPTDSVFLDGSASTDPDGTIREWAWKKVDGPSSFNLVTTASSTTVVRNLIAGVYLFELFIKDNDALSARDTVQVTVNNPSQQNRPPVANAGADQVTTLPANIVVLDGSASTDPDNNITGYLWTKISGPQTFHFGTANLVRTQVNLVEGIYLFELKVTDGPGLFDRDTVQITVKADPSTQVCDNSSRPVVNAQLIPAGTLSQARRWITVASVNNKILFAGGEDGAGQYSVAVDIYDIPGNTWSTAKLGVARVGIATATSGDKVFFGGGETGDGTFPSDFVDIYDASGNTWAASRLSLAGNGIAAAAVGNKVLFAGGYGGFINNERHQKVDIFDLGTGTWSTASLSEEKRGGLAAVTAGNKIYFAGGETMVIHGSNNWENNWAASKAIDIYDDATNSWSRSAMLEGRLFFAAATIGDKIIFAGGHSGIYPSIYTSCNVEIRDINAGSSRLEQLFKPSLWHIDAGQNAVVKDNKIIFYRASGNDRDKFDIYDMVNNTWSIGVLPQPFPEAASIISANNTVYVAGGMVNGVPSNKVWKLEF